ncbi:MAG: outer membrane lipoprotein-sorting protein [Deltaproteobacteria bacterium]|nr:outer membrane lipoprotein-sorting protein [Deltaproteobacteria bacterium]
MNALLRFAPLLLLLPGIAAPAHAEDAQAVVEASFHYYRGDTSVGTVDMTVHRPEWERVFTIKAWTKGEDRSLIRILGPPKDRGNGTLKKGPEMWMYNPKVNRVIKVPPSMMSQSWMGSDFSNNDLAKSDSLIKDYNHEIVGTGSHEGKKVYVIESHPMPRAPVVWGKQRLRIREDHIFLEETFFDQDMEPVKTMSAGDIRMMGGKLFPATWKMQKADAEGEYTLLEYREIAFDVEIPAGTFTLSNLRTPER